MKNTVALQVALERAEKEKQVLRSKYDSAKSTVAFLKKKSEEGRERQLELKTTAGEYERMVLSEEKKLEQFQEELSLYQEIENHLSLWISESRKLLQILQKRAIGNAGPLLQQREAEKKTKSRPKAPPPAPPPENEEVSSPRSEAALEAPQAVKKIILRTKPPESPE